MFVLLLQLKNDNQQNNHLIYGGLHDIFSRLSLWQCHILFYVFSRYYVMENENICYSRLVACLKPTPWSWQLSLQLVLILGGGVVSVRKFKYKLVFLLILINDLSDYLIIQEMELFKVLSNILIKGFMVWHFLSKEGSRLSPLTHYLGG